MSDTTHEEVDGLLTAFHLPVRPPLPRHATGACPVPEGPPGSKRPRGVAGGGDVEAHRQRRDGLLHLLHTSTTLDYDADARGRTLERLRTQYPARFQALQAALADLTESSLGEIFEGEEKMENDTRRRVDYDRCRAVLRENETKKLSQCVSCLTRGQHRRYRDVVLTYAGVSPLPAAVVEEYPDAHHVLELVALEQAAFHRKFQAEVLSCAECAKDREFTRRTRAPVHTFDGDSAGGPDGATHVCWNHNYLPPHHVLPFLRRWWGTRVAGRLEAFLETAAASRERTAGDPEAEAPFPVEPRGVWAAKRGRPAPHGPPKGPLAEVQVSLTPATVSLAALWVAAAAACPTASPPTASARRSPSPRVTVPPVYPLPLERLEREVAAGAPMDEGGLRGAVHEPLFQPLPPRLARRLTEGGLPPIHTVALDVARSAVVELLLAGLESHGEEFRLPVEVRVGGGARDGRAVHLILGKPLPRTFMSRRGLHATAMRRLIDEEPHLPSVARGGPSGTAPAGHASEGRRRRVCPCASLVRWSHPSARASEADALAFHVLGKAQLDRATGEPLHRLVKMEYNCKGYTVLPDDPATFFYEGFSRRELVELLVGLRLFPSARVYLYRVNAYASAVMGVEELDASTVEGLLRRVPALGRDVEVDVPHALEILGSVLHRVVEEVVVATAEHLLHHATAGEAERRTHFLLVGGRGQISLSSVEALYAGYAVPPAFSASAIAEEAFVERSSSSVCRRQYRRPAVWPYADRIPFTYGPQPPSAMVINRTTAQRFPEEYYREHDTWSHTTTHYVAEASDRTDPKAACPLLRAVPG